MQTEDPLIRCPYNQSHQILKSRMQAHIVKCKKNYPTADKMVCPFNAIHHVDKVNYQYHVSTCPDRSVIETHKYEVCDSLHGDVNGIPYQEPELPPNEENWDADVAVNAYDPSEHVENAPILRSLQGATKSQRKAFRLRERQRMQRIMDGEPPASSSSSSGSHSGVENTMAPLRLPRQPSEALVLLDPNLGLGRGRGGNTSDEVRAPGRAIAPAMSSSGNKAVAQAMAPGNGPIAEARAPGYADIAQVRTPGNGAIPKARASGYAEIVQARASGNGAIASAPGNEAISPDRALVLGFGRAGPSLGELPVPIVGRGKLFLNK